MADGLARESNMARLTLLLLDNKLWNDDMSRVMQGTIAMQSRASGATTVANAWGTLATEKFAAAFESQPVTGRQSRRSTAAKQVLDWAQESRGGKLGPPVAAGAERFAPRAIRHRKSVGEDSGQRRDSAQVANFERLHDYEDSERRSKHRTAADGGRAISSACISRSTRKAT